MIAIGAGITDAYNDSNGVAQLKAQANKNSPEQLKQTAQQFESLFLQMTMKNMRQAGAPLEAGIAESNGSRTFRDMYDQQMAKELAKTSNFGFADMLVKQLGGAGGKSNSAAVQGKGLDDYRQNSMRMIPLRGDQSAGSAQGLRMPGRIGAIGNSQGRLSAEDKKAFFQAMLPEAEAAAKQLGVDPKLLLSQVALETGWGKHTPRHGDGSDSHNLFGIKAGRSWQGGRVASKTLEYSEGVAVRKTDYFRAYGSYDEGFRDYVGVLQNNPRYNDALAKPDDPKQYMVALQKAGYATDPHYANKVMAIYRQWRDYDPAAVEVAGNAPAVSGQPATGEESV